VIVIGVVCTALISNLVPSSDSAYSRYWAIYSTAVFVTCVIFGFTRLSTPSTLFLAFLNAAVAVWAAKDYGNAKVMQRLLVHIASVNFMCFMLYRLINLRERKLFLRAIRQRSMIDLKRARDRAEEASRAKSAFLANMSHEIRTPMNGIIGSLALLDRTDSEERRRTLIDVARQAADGLLQTLNEILDYAKLDAKGSALNVGPLDLPRVCRMAVQTFQANATAKGIALNFDLASYPADVPMVAGDEEKLRRIVMNLVSNAIKFTAAGGVTLRLRGVRVAGGVKVKIRIADTGIGIARGMIPLLFEPFFQVESGMSRSYGGTGLGLAISRQLAHAMGGHVRVRSKVGRGSVFTVSLLLPECEQRAPVARPEPALPIAGLEAAAGKTVLLVEDNAVNAFISAASLESMGVRSVHASDGTEAVELFRSRTFDAVLMDCEMPVMDGFAATRLIREYEAQSRLRRTPIIALTANALTGDREQCLARGMDDYLSKPIELAQLGALIAKWLGKEPPVPETVGVAKPKTAANEVPPLGSEFKLPFRKTSARAA
jgi:signal transduction histidine kinase/CheY-like chemotaxis protein